MGNHRRNRPMSQIERQKEVAEQIAPALLGLSKCFGRWRATGLQSRQPRKGPMTDRHVAGRRPEGQHHTPLLSMFARSALNQLVNADDGTLPDWFEAAAAICR